MDSDVSKLRRMHAAQVQIVSLARTRLAALHVEIARNDEALVEAEHAAENSSWAMMLPQIHLRRIHRLQGQKIALASQVDDLLLICRREMKKEEILGMRLSKAKIGAANRSEVGAILESVERLSVTG